MAPAPATAQRAESPLGDELGDELSDDSLLASPNSPEVKQKRDRHRVSRRSPNASPLRVSSKPPLGKVASKIRASSMPRTHRLESPAPRPVVKDHIMTEAQGRGVEERLAALENQQRMDHTYLGEMANAARTLGANLELLAGHTRQIEGQVTGFAALDLHVKRDMAQLRAKLEDQVKEAIGITAAAADAKLAEIQNALTALQLNASNASDREAQMADYLNKLHGDRPREGQAVIASLKFLHDGMAEVQGRVVTLETNSANYIGGVVFTDAMQKGFYDMHDHHKLLDQGMANLTASLGDAQTRLEAAELKLHAHEQGLFVQGSNFGGGCGQTAADPLNLRGAFAGGACHVNGCNDHACTGTGGGNPFASHAPQLPPGVPQGPSGGGGSSGAGVLQAVIGGNNRCHCIHVKELQDRVTTLEATRGGGLGGSGGLGGIGGDSREPLIPRDLQARKALERKELPLSLRGPLGAIGYKDRSLLDDKLALQPEFRFDGSKGGPHWKGKLERYIISRAPILKDLLEWAEFEDMNTITSDRLQLAIGNALTEEQVMMADAAIWGFLSSALTNSAETIFKGAETLRGFDAWRRITRYIDHGRSIRLEELRRTVRTMHMRPMKGLEHVEEGIAEFENLLRDYEDAGGTPFAEEEKKADLLAILPSELREHLLWYVTDKGKTFAQFRDIVRTQTGQVLMTRKKLPLHFIDGNRAIDESNDDEVNFNDIDFSEVNSMEDLMAVVNRMRGRFNNRNRTNVRPMAPALQDRERPPRKCVNCGETHQGRCTKAQVPSDKRPCWWCGKPGHISKDCPAKSNKAIKAVADAQNSLKAMFVIDDEGYQTVQRGARQRTRPQPSKVTFGDVLAQNSFAALSDGSSSSTATSRPSSMTMRCCKCEWIGTTKAVRCPECRGNCLCHASDDSSGSGARSCAPTDETVLSKPHDEVSPGSAQLAKTHVVVRPPSSSCIGILRERRPNEEVHVKVKDETPRMLRRALAEAQRAEDTALAAEIERFKDSGGGSLNVIMEPDEEICAATERVIIKPAVDSGAVANVLHPRDLPSDAEPVPLETDKHFVGAGGGNIERYGTCATRLEGEHGEIGCNWQLADVTRPLHSVSTIAGPYDGPGKQDILFNNKRCVVVPAGTVDKILKSVAAVFEYHREGNLYTAEVAMSAFGRQGRTV